MAEYANEMKKSIAHYKIASLDSLLEGRRSSEPESAPTVADVWEQIGERLKRQRVAFEWRQSDVADRAGVSVQTVKSVEKGGVVSGESFFRLLIAFGHGPDLLKMLESPHFPDLQSHQRFVESKHASEPASKRVRCKAEPLQGRHALGWSPVVSFSANAGSGGQTKSTGDAKLRLEYQYPRVEPSDEVSVYAQRIGLHKCMNEAVAEKSDQENSHMGLIASTGAKARRLHFKDGLGKRAEWVGHVAGHKAKLLVCQADDDEDQVVTRGSGGLGKEHWGGKTRR